MYLVKFLYKCLMKILKNPEFFLFENAKSNLETHDFFIISRKIGNSNFRGAPWVTKNDIL